MTKHELEHVLKPLVADGWEIYMDGQVAILKKDWPSPYIENQIYRISTTLEAAGLYWMGTKEFIRQANMAAMNELERQAKSRGIL